VKPETRLTTDCTDFTHVAISGHSGDARRGEEESPAFGALQIPRLRLGMTARLHEALGTGPGFYYLWDREAA
jgi:hypothetical protein